jgi:hypothetical protein
VILLPLHFAFADRLGRDLEGFVGSPRPLATWEAMRGRFRNEPRRLLAADRPEASTPFLPTYLGLLAYPNAVAGDWTGALWIPRDPLDRATRLFDALARGEEADGAPPITPLVVGLRGYVTEAVDRAGGALGLVRDPRSPRVLAFLQVDPAARGPGGCVLIGARRTTLRTFSPQPGNGVLILTAAPGRGPVPPAGLRLLVTSTGRPPDRRLVQFPRVELPVALARGAGRVDLEFEAPALTDDWRACVLSAEIVAEPDATR